MKEEEKGAAKCADSDVENESGPRLDPKQSGKRSYAKKIGDIIFHEIAPVPEESARQHACTISQRPFRTRWTPALHGRRASSSTTSPVYGQGEVAGTPWPEK